MSSKKRCFVIMPFGKKGTKKYQINKDIFEKLISPVVTEFDYECVRSDEIRKPGSITAEIIRRLDTSELVIADLSNQNANVFYELGVRHALQKNGMITIIQDGQKIPFDLADYRALEYSPMVGGDTRFHKLLSEYLKCFEKIDQNESDSPIYDILGPRMKLWVEPKYINEHVQELENEITVLKRKIEELQNELKSNENQIKGLLKGKKKEIEKTRSLIEEKERISNNHEKLRLQLQSLLNKTDKFEEKRILRKTPMQIDVQDAIKMLEHYNFFDTEWNTSGLGFHNEIIVQRKYRGQILIDKTSNLMWQVKGSIKGLCYDDAKKYITDLNQQNYYGFHDWRLPTLEEAMSIVKPQKTEKLYICPDFDQKVDWIWTADTSTSDSEAWAVFYDDGYCGKYPELTEYCYAKAVRSVQDDKN